MESDLHKHLKNQALYWLKARMVDLCAAEVRLMYKRKKVKADALGINLKRKEARIIEVKVSREDFRRDDVLEAPHSYYAISDYAYLLTPVGLLKKEEIPKGYGLLEIDEYDTITVKRNPVRNINPLLTFETLLRRTGRAATNAFLFQQLSRETKDQTAGAFAKKAQVHLISATCPLCKKRKQYLVKQDQENTMCKARSCKHLIPLNRARVHQISSYNQAFFREMQTLMNECATD